MYFGDNSMGPEHLILFHGCPVINLFNNYLPSLIDGHLVCFPSQTWCHLSFQGNASFLAGWLEPRKIYPIACEGSCLLEKGRPLFSWEEMEVKAFPEITWGQW